MIKAYDGQIVHNSMIDALVAQELRRQQHARIAELEAENRALRVALDIRKAHDAQVYTALIKNARREYPAPERGTALGDVWWALVGWAVLAVGSVMDRLRV